jgi:tankyrase
MVKMHPVLAEYFEKKPDLYPQALEAKYSRVFNKIMAMWGTQPLEEHFSDLIVDKRGNRAGSRRKSPRTSSCFPAAHPAAGNRGMKRSDGSRTHGATSGCATSSRPSRSSTARKVSSSPSSAATSARSGCSSTLESGPIEKDALGVTPFIKAAMFNRSSVASLLIKAHADVNMANSQGYTPLHWAALKGYLDIVEMLLAAGAAWIRAAALG